MEAAPQADIDRLNEFATIGASWAANALAQLVGRPIHTRPPVARAGRQSWRGEGETGVFFESDGDRRIVAVARDVTQQSAERAVVRKRDDHYRTLVESGGRPAAIIDRSGAVIFSNRAFKVTFGRDVSLEDLFLRMTDEVRGSMETGS